MPSLFHTDIDQWKYVFSPYDTYILCLWIISDHKMREFALYGPSTVRS